MISQARTCADLAAAMAPATGLLSTPTDDRPRKRAARIVVLRPQNGSYVAKTVMWRIGDYARSFRR